MRPGLARPHCVIGRKHARARKSALASNKLLLAQVAAGDTAAHARAAECRLYGVGSAGPATTVVRTFPVESTWIRQVRWSGLYPGPVQIAAKEITPDLSLSTETVVLHSTGIVILVYGPLDVTGQGTEPPGTLGKRPHFVAGFTLKKRWSS